MDPQSSAVSEDVGIEGGSDVSLREMSTSEQLQSSVSVENNGHIRKLRTNENLNHSLMYCKIKVFTVGMSKLSVSTVHCDADEDDSVLVQ